VTNFLAHTAGPNRAGGTARSPRRIESRRRNPGARAEIGESGRNLRRERGRGVAAGRDSDWKLRKGRVFKLPSEDTRFPEESGLVTRTSGFGLILPSCVRWPTYKYLEEIVKKKYVSRNATHAPISSTAHSWEGAVPCREARIWWIRHHLQRDKREEN
jgi:hypothetical protein